MPEDGNSRLRDQRIDTGAAEPPSLADSSFPAR